MRSPIDGVVTKLKPHAVIVTSTRGMSILIHLGIDTVSLHGKGFAALVDEGEIVPVGHPLIHWDLAPAREATLSPHVPVIVVSGPSPTIASRATPGDCAALDLLFTASTSGE